MSPIAGIFAAFCLAASLTFVEAVGGTALPVSTYDMLNGQGDTQGYQDTGYAPFVGTLAPLTPLSGGKGFLADGIAPAEPWHVANAATSGNGPWVGWRDVEPTITFRFGAAVDAVNLVRLYVDNSNNGGVLAPTAVVIASAGGSNSYALPGAPVPVGWVEFEVSGLSGTWISVQLKHTHMWVMLAEAEFIVGADTPFGGPPGTVLAPVSTYEMLNGEADTYVYYDNGYTPFVGTFAALTPLTGGKGYLADGFEPTVPWHVANAATGGNGPWVGWRSVEPTITFYFGGSIANVRHIRLLLDNSDVGLVKAPTAVVIGSAAGSNSYPVVGAPMPVGWVGFDVAGTLSGNWISVQLKKDHMWVMLGEAEFYRDAPTTVTKEAKRQTRYFWQQAATTPSWTQSVSLSPPLVASSPVPTAPYSVGAAADLSLHGRDNLYVQTVLAPGQTAATLYAVRFTPDVIPPTAVIKGLKVTMPRFSSQEGLKDISMQLLVGGVPVPASERYTVRPSTYWYTKESNFKVGGPTDLWGFAPGTLTPAIVNDPLFGVAITTKNVHATRTITANWNEIEFVITYEVAAPPLEGTVLDAEGRSELGLLAEAATNSTAFACIAVAAVVAAVIAAVAVVTVVRRRKAIGSAASSLPRSDDEVDTTDVTLAVDDADSTTGRAQSNALFRSD